MQAEDIAQWYSIGLACHGPGFDLKQKTSKQQQKDINMKSYNATCHEEQSRGREVRTMWSREVASSSGAQSGSVSREILMKVCYHDKNNLREECCIWITCYSQLSERLMQEPGGN